jgi:ectoine hydroxylase-related dioxygenase (phytanoyl-CoA dioxygenase family)
LFLSYYLTDTNLENGCLRVIPGTHTKRIDLHDLLTTPHTDAARNTDEQDPHMFCDHPDAVDVPVKAGALVIAEGRMLHAARANRSDKRRTLLLCWHRRSTTVPENWTGEIPESIFNRDPETGYEPTRVPGRYLV